MNRRWTMPAVAMVALLPSCELAPRLYLSVRTEAGSPVRSVRVRVYSPPTASTPLPDGTLQRALAPGATLDLRVVARVGGERVRVLVEGYDQGGGEVRVRQDWIASLPAEGGGYLQVVLWNTCLGNPCGAALTCAADGVCVSNEVGTTPVARVDGGALGACAGDLGGCGGRPDGGAGHDAGNDAGADVPRDGGRCPGPSATARPDWTRCGSVWCPTACAGASGCMPIEALRLGRDHACALRADRSVVCWGSNGVGALGNDRMDGVAAAVPVGVIRQVTGTPLTGMQSIFAGFDATCGVDDVGDLVCWGAPGGDPLGLEFNPAYAAAPAVRLRRADAGVEDNTFRLAATAPDHTCAVTGRGGVRCRTRAFFLPDGTGEYYPTPAAYPVRDIVQEDGSALDGVTGLGLGYSHACAARRDGSVWCWGTNRLGQLGRPLVGTAAGVAFSDVARRIGGLAPVTAIAVGDFFTCALVGADVRCWGLAGYGRLGNLEGTVECPSSNECAVTPVSVAGLGELVRFQASPPVEVTAAAEHGCVRLANGNVWCWGNNGVGELGLPNTGTGAVAARAGIAGPPVFTGADEVIAGGGGGGEDISWTCARRAEDCTWWCWGRVPGEVPPAAEAWRPRAVRWTP